MRKIYELTILLLITSFAFGQNCDDKLAVNEIDIVSKRKKLKSAFMSFKVNFKENHTFSFELNNGILTFLSSSTSTELNQIGKSLEFVFKNGDKTLFKFDSPKISKEINGKTVYFNDTDIDYSTLELFASQNIVNVNSDGLNETFKVKEKRAKVITEYSNCFFSTIDKEKDLGTKKEKKTELNGIPSYYKPCNITVDEEDEFEGYRKKALHYAGIAKPTESGFPLFINLKSIDGKLYMSAELDAISYCITNDSKVLIKLENETIVRLPHLGGTKCGKRAMYEVLFTEKEKAELRRSPIKLIRLETEDGKIDLPIIMIKNYFVENIDCI